MTDETLQSIIIKSDWQAYEEGGIQIGFRSKKDNSACQEIFKYCPTPSPGNVLWSDTIYTWLSRDTVPDRIFPGKCEPLVLKPPSYGCDFILLNLSKMSAGGERGVEARILGLGGIQLARTHKAATRTKLLAVLVWLQNRTTQGCAK